MITSRKLVSVFWDKWRPPAETGDRWWLHRSQRGRLDQPTSPRPDALPVFLSGCEEAYSDKPCLFFMWAALIASLAARVSRCFDRGGRKFIRTTITFKQRQTYYSNATSQKFESHLFEWSISFQWRCWFSSCSPRLILHLISSRFKLEFVFKTLASQTRTNTCTQTSRHWDSIRIGKKKTNKLCKLFLPAAVSVKRSHSHLVIINYKYSIHDKASAGAPTG